MLTFALIVSIEDSAIIPREFFIRRRFSGLNYHHLVPEGHSCGRTRASSDEGAAFDCRYLWRCFVGRTLSRFELEPSNRPRLAE